MAEPAWRVGCCWRCEGDSLPVIWIGDVANPDFGHAPFYACAPCMDRLEALLRAHFGVPSPLH
ncbi:hypothetical protein ACFY0G_32215 [Streptomyces sp. NPDC001552]|uniref:hypothetical protein n=1 Tax=Streptomyces sp. NPDC001552 TaxID=3364587 RepID=UPI00369174B5